MGQNLMSKVYIVQELLQKGHILTLLGFEIQSLNLKNPL